MKHVIMELNGETHVFLVKRISNILGASNGIITFENVIDTNPPRLKKYLRKDIKKVFKKALYDTLVAANVLGYNFDVFDKNKSYKSSYLVSSIVDNGLNSNMPKEAYLDKLYAMLGFSEEDKKNEVLLVFGINNTALKSKMEKNNESI